MSLSACVLATVGGPQLSPLNHHLGCFAQLFTCIIYSVIPSY